MNLLVSGQPLMEKVLVLEERVKNLSEELDEFKLQVLSGKIKS
ncbi:hypothetical protein [Wolbachia endosymbiont of Nasonia giraulti]